MSRLRRWMKRHAISLITWAIALVVAACGTSGEVRPPATHAQLGQGRAVQLLQDEVQEYGPRVSATAPAGSYAAAFEDDEYVYYRGPRITQHFGFGMRTADGGLALSKRRLGNAFIYTIDRWGKPAVEKRPIRGSITVLTR
jgi:hypothetical protein